MFMRLHMWLTYNTNTSFILGGISCPQSLIPHSNGTDITLHLSIHRNDLFNKHVTLK